MRHRLIALIILTTTLALSIINQASATSDISQLNGIARSEQLRTASGGNIFIVNSTDFRGDATPNGICETIDGVCTLRAAIQEANITSTPDTIHFNIPGAGPHVIQPSGPLPDIEHPLTIDGSTQPGASCPDVLNPADIRIVINGVAGGTGDDANGFSFRSFAHDSLVRGLAIINYHRAGIDVTNSDNLRIECNHIGIEADGITAAGNSWGIVVRGLDGNVIIGGTSSNSRTQRNVISGNTLAGISSANSSQTATLITGNYIGTNASGTGAVGNRTGLFFYGSNLTLGGIQPYHTNVISGNDLHAIQLFSTSDNTSIDNNIVGLNALGSGSLGNGAGGIVVVGNISGSSANAIGIGLSAPNIIANNGGHGIWLDNRVEPVGRVTIRFNEIYNDDGLGINIGVGGTDPELPNGDNNRARLLSIDGNDLRLAFVSPGNGAPYQFDVYHNDACDDSGFGEGQTYVESFTLSPNSAELFETVTLANSLPSGKLLTVAVTNPLGRTSEFSNCLAEVTTFTVNTNADTEDADAPNASCADANGDCSLRAAIQEINASAGAGPFTILFNLPVATINDRIIFIDASLGQLPNISKQVRIDATSQPAARCASNDGTVSQLVTLSGNNLVGTSSGLELVAGSDGSTIAGLVFGSFPGDGLKVYSNNNQFFCNVFGLFSSSANGDDGLQVSGNANIVGGTDLWRRNYMSGNGDAGIELRSDANNNLVQGNYVGTFVVGASSNLRGINVRESAFNNNIGGTAVLISDTVEILGHNVVSGNADHGIRLVSSGSGNNVGGNYVGVLDDGVTVLANGGAGIRSTSPNTRIGQTVGFLGLLYDVPNIVGGNGESGIHISDFNGVAGTGALIKNNFVGVAADGTTVIGNTNHGILVESDEATVQGNMIVENGQNGVYLSAGVEFTDVLSNVIRANNEHGIQVSATANHNYLKGNAFAGNKGLAIDLDADDELSDDVFKRVEVISAESTNATVTINYEDGLPNTLFYLEIYRNDSCGKEGSDGQEPLNKLAISFTTDAQGDWSDTYSTLDFAAGDGIAALITANFAGSQPGRTAEFSNCVVATGSVVTAVAVSEKLKISPSSSSGHSSKQSPVWVLVVAVLATATIWRVVGTGRHGV